MRGLLGVAAVMLLAFATTGARAQVSSGEILRSLKPAPLTRGLAVQATRRIEVIPGQEAEVLDRNKDLPRIDLAIEFEYASERPTQAGERQLMQLAEALKDPVLRSSRFILAGHTDSRGSDDYNLRLSERRATAVARFLAGAAQIEPTRLAPTGFGRSRLLANIDPEDPRNRRVEIVNLMN